jgi:hypothetical protein
MVKELKLVYGVAEEPALSAFADYAGLRFMMEQIDGDFETRGVPTGNVRGRHLLDVRIRVSRQFERSREAMLEAVKATQMMIAFRERGKRKHRKDGQGKERAQPASEPQAPDPVVAALMLRRANEYAAVARELYVRDAERDAAARHGVLGNPGDGESGTGVGEPPAQKKESAGPSIADVPAGRRHERTGKKQAQQEQAALVSELRQLMREFPEGSENAERYQEWLDPDNQLTECDLEVLRAEIEGIRRARSAGNRQRG